VVRHAKALKISTADSVKTFLMYDMDVSAVNSRIEQCRDSTKLLSNPCFEVWILLHEMERIGPLTTNECVTKLRRTGVWKNYSKGEFTNAQRSVLVSNMEDAICRAEALEAYANPSSTVYLLIKEIRRGMP